MLANVQQIIKEDCFDISAQCHFGTYRQAGLFLGATRHNPKRRLNHGSSDNSLCTFRADLEGMGLEPSQWAWPLDFRERLSKYWTGRDTVSCRANPNLQVSEV
jgi:hypothetical protein